MVFPCFFWFETLLRESFLSHWMLLESRRLYIRKYHQSHAEPIHLPLLLLSACTVQLAQQGRGWKHNLQDVAASPSELMPEKEIQNDLSPSRIDYINIDLTYIYIYYIIDISNISTSFLKYDKSTQGCFQRTGHRPTSSLQTLSSPSVRRMRSFHGVGHGHGCHGHCEGGTIRMWRMWLSRANLGFPYNGIMVCFHIPR
jgi:hypothetical protein